MLTVLEAEGHLTEDRMNEIIAQTPISQVEDSGVGTDCNHPVVTPAPPHNLGHFTTAELIQRLRETASRLDGADCHDDIALSMLQTYAAAEMLAAADRLEVVVLPSPPQQETPRDDRKR